MDHAFDPLDWLIKYEPQTRKQPKPKKAPPAVISSTPFIESIADPVHADREASVPSPISEEDYALESTPQPTPNPTPNLNYVSLIAKVLL